MERTNARGRHRYCAPFKEWIVEQALKPGISTAGLAMRNQVNANQLRRWVLLGRRRVDVAPDPRLLPVIVAREPALAAAVSQPQASIEIELAGAIVRVRNDVAPTTLRLVLEALRGMTP